MLRYAPAVSIALALSACAGSLQIPAEPSGGGFVGPELKALALPFIGPNVGCTQGPKLGRVLIAYSINAKGRAERIGMIESGGQDLDRCAFNAMAEARYAVPSNWMAAGGPGYRYQQGFLFQVTGEPVVQPFAPGIPVSEITMTRISR
jgi:hypothetical protein